MQAVVHGLGGRGRVGGGVESSIIARLLFTVLVQNVVSHTKLQ